VLALTLESFAEARLAADRDVEAALTAIDESVTAYPRPLPTGTRAATAPTRPAPRPPAGKPPGGCLCRPFVAGARDDVVAA